MSDFQLKVGGDFSELLRGFQQLESRAQQAGTTVGRGISDGIQGFSSKSLAALYAELSRLQQRQTKVAVDSSAFDKAGQKIERVKALITEAERRRLSLTVDDRSISALQTRLAQLQSKQTKVAVDSTDFDKLQREIVEVETDLNRASQRKLLINADPGSIVAMRARLSELQGELERTKVGSARFRELQKEIGSLSNEINAATGSAGGLGGAMQRLAPIMAAVGVAVFGVQRALSGVIAGASAFDAEVRKAAAIEGSDSFDKLATSITNVAQVAAGTPTQVAQLATALSRAGFSAQETSAALEGIVAGAEASSISFEQMGSIVSNTLRTFGKEAGDTASVVDTLVMAANSANQTVPDVGEALSYAGSTAASLGIELEDLVGTIALLADGGIRASRAGTALSTGLNRLQRAVTETDGEMAELGRSNKMLGKAIKALGADVVDASGKLKPLDQVLIGLKSSFESLGQGERAIVANALFGEEAGRAFLALMNRTTEDIGKMFDKMRSAEGSTTQTRASMDSFSLAMARLQGNIETVTNAIGGAFMAALRPLAEIMNIVLSVAQALPSPIRALGAAAAAAGIAAAGAAITWVTFKQAIANVNIQATITALKGLTSEMRGRFLSDVARAKAAWTALRAAFTTTSSNAAVAGLAQIAKGLRDLNAAQAVAGFKQLGLAMQAAALKGKAALVALAAQAGIALKASLAAASAETFKLGVNLTAAGRNSAAAEAGLKGLSLLLQRGMTTGADGAAKASLGLSGALNSLSTLTAKGALTGALTGAGTAIKAVGVALAGAAVAAAPLLIALAAIVPAAIGYNAIMGEVRKDTEEAWQSVEQFGAVLKENGTAFEDLGLKGGPLAEVMTRVQRGFKDAGEAISRIPVIGGAAKRALDALGETLKLLTGIKLIEWGKQAIATIQAMYAEATKNQKIIEAGDILEQYGKQADAVSDRAAKFIKTLQGLDKIPSGSVEAYTVALNKNREQLSGSIAAATDLAARYTLLADQTRAGAAATAEEQQRRAQLVAQYETLAKSYASDAKLKEAQLKQLEDEAFRRGLVVDKLREQQESMAALAVQARDLATAITDIGAQSQVGQSLLNLAQALGELEQSRFAITKARGSYELQQAQDALARQIKFYKDRGASELKIKRLQEEGEKGLEAIRERNRLVENQALQARYDALIAEQGIQQQLLALSQEKARNEANLEVMKARLALLSAQQELSEAQAKGDDKAIAVAREKLGIAGETLRVQETNLNTLNQTQPLERQIADAKGEAAANGLRAQAASQGMELSTSRAAGFASDLAIAAGQAGSAMDGAATEGQQLADSTGRATTQAQGLAAETRGISSGLDSAAAATGGVTKGLAAAEGKADDTRDATGKIGDAGVGAARALNPLLQTMDATRKTTELAVQLARQFTQISGSVGGVANAMVRAASAAREFYNWLAQASGLPGSRWTGGPVEAGQTVRINDGPNGRSLGQESFLSSAGKLSLINKPANALWTPPTAGVVLPAGVTEGLKARGVFDSGRMARAAVSARPTATPRGSDGQLAATVAQQAVAIGKLQQAVDRLTAKDWNVNVRVRGDGQGPQYLNQLNRTL